MAYLYRAVSYKNPELLGLPAGTNAADITDFETNYKATALLVNSVNLAETTFEIDKTYTQFKALVVSPLTWANIEYTEDSVKYIFNLLSDDPL